MTVLPFNTNRAMAAGNEVASLRSATGPIPMSQAVNEAMLLPCSCSHKLFHPLWSLSTTWTVFDVLKALLFNLGAEDEISGNC